MHPIHRRQERSSCSCLHHYGSCTINFTNGANGYGTAENVSTFLTGALSIPASNVGSSTTRHYRFGRQVRGLSRSTPVYTYEADVTIAVTCGHDSPFPVRNSSHSN